MKSIVSSHESKVAETSDQFKSALKVKKLTAEIQTKKGRILDEIRKCDGFVSDLNEAKRFYANLLEMPIILEKENKLIFQLEGTQLVAFKCEKNGGAGDYSNEARTVLVFEVDSVEQTFYEMKSKGVKFLHEIPTEAR
ncbi:VOC family protein [Peribacillus sp. B-H-3]|uniref:VOC family protein n=1 Tax=Peribacillus sp. B-H-3 TaxID=3400420 RepID=UPI003B0204E4